MELTLRLPVCQDDFNASQVTPEWHSWLSHIRKDSPDLDPIVQASTQSWQTVSPSLPSILSPIADGTHCDQAHHESLTGTRGAYKSYSTVKPKISAWSPKVAPRV